MPPQEGGIKGIYYTVSDKGWSLAEWLEAKGLPVATFCESRHVNPLLLFLAIILAVFVILLLAAGAFGGVSYATLRVNVQTEGGAPIDGAVVSYTWGGEEASNTTDPLGKTFLQVPKGTEVALFASKEGYVTGSQRATIDKDSDTTTIKLTKRVGNLRVNVDVAGGKPLPSGAYVAVSSPGEVAAQQSVSNGEALFEDLPAGIEVTPVLKLGKQSIPGDEVTIREGQTVEVDITVPNSALATSIQVKVKDSALQNVNGAEVRLYDWNTQTPVGSTQKTVMGVATFSDIPMGATMFATVNPAADTPQYSSYNGKTANQQLIVSIENPTFAIELQIVGLVRVCVYDENDAPLMDGTVRIWGTDGKPYSSSKTIDQECEEFTGLPRGVRIYPEVNAPGYLKYLNPSIAQTLDYSKIVTFNVDISPLSSGQGVTVFAHVTDCDGAAVNGAKVMIIDSSSYAILGEATTACGAASVTLMDECGNIQSLIASGTQIYAVAWDNKHVLGVSGIEVAGPDTVLDVEICKADDSNSGAVQVCVYKDGDPFEGAHLELHASDDKLLRTARADDGDEDNCYTFINLPDGESVYATALDLGTSPKDSETVTVVAGDIIPVVIYAGTAPIFLAKGNVEICAKDAATNLSLVADVTLFDFITGAPIIAGQTAARGCRLFTGLEAETASGGRVVPREVYVTASKTGYGDYNGASSDIADMVPNGTLNIAVRLSEAFDVCVQLRASDTTEPLQASVVLYYDEEATAPIEKKKTSSDGVVHFRQAKKDDYYFKVVENLTLYDPLEKYAFSREEISEGSCGMMTLYDLGTLCDLGVELLDGSIETPLGEKTQIPFTILKGGQRADNSILDEGSTASYHKVQLTDGSSANVTLWAGGQQKSFSLKYASTSEDSEAQLTAELEVSATGNYSSTLQVSENELCSRQALFDLTVYEAMLKVTVDSVEFDPVADKTKTFCIYVKDQNDDDVDDASVTVSVDEMDGWAQTATKTASYDEVKTCYKGSLVSSMAPEDDGSYLFSVVVKRADMTKIVQSEADISRSELCGNGEIDSSEACDDSATNDTGCDEGMECNDDCSACEEEECGDLSVSSDSATLEIGSGKSAGLCVHVSDSCGDVEDATVQVKLYGDYGWPTDTSLSAGYDSARGCYYAPISESVAWPSSYRPTDIDEMLGSKSVGIAATEGDRDGSGTGEITITCGCDEEKWCELTCKCDEDCEDGFSGSLDLFGCLTLMGQNGYGAAGTAGYQYPQMSPWSSPYLTGGYSQYPYPASYGGYAGGNVNGYNPGASATGGGMSIGTDSFSISGPGGGIGFDLEKCKELLGIGGGSKVKSYVMIKDPENVVGTDGCAALQEHFTKSGTFKYFYVDSGKGDDTCCTDKVKKSGTCSLEKFNKLLEKDPKDRTLITIASAKSPEAKSMQNFKILVGQDPLKDLAVRDTSTGMTYGSGAVFGGQRKGERELVWSYAGIKPQFSKAKDIWFMSADGGDFKIGYPPGTLEPARTIVVSGLGMDLGIPGVLFGSDSNAAGADLWPVSPETKLYVIDYYKTLESPDSLSGALSKKISFGSSLKFAKPGTKLDVCKNGVFDEEEFDLTMLKASSDLYVVALEAEPTKTCEVPSSKTAITYKGLDQSAALNLAYGKSKGSAKLLVLGTDDEEKAGELISDFLGGSPEAGPGEKPKIPSGTKIYLGTDNYGIIRAKCLEGKQVCTLQGGETQGAHDGEVASGIESIAGLEGEPKKHILDCVCGGGEDLPGKVALALSAGSTGIDLGSLQPGQVQFTVYKVSRRGEQLETLYSGDEAVTRSGNTFTLAGDYFVKGSAYYIEVSVTSSTACGKGTATIGSSEIKPGETTSAKTVTLTKIKDVDCTPVEGAAVPAAASTSIEGWTIVGEADGWWYKSFPSEDSYSCKLMSIDSAGNYDVYCRFETGETNSVYMDDHIISDVSSLPKTQSFEYNTVDKIYTVTLILIAIDPAKKAITMDATETERPR